MHPGGKRKARRNEINILAAERKWGWSSTLAVQSGQEVVVRVARNPASLTQEYCGPLSPCVLYCWLHVVHYWVRDEKKRHQSVEFT